MRVLFIENAGNKNAGAFHSLLALICLLKKYGVQAYVALPDRADGLSLLEKNDISYITMRECSYTWMIDRKLISIEQLKMPAKDIMIRNAAKKLANYIRDNKIDVVHENTSACYIGAYAAKIANIKHIWHIREFMEEDFNTQIWWKNRAYSLMDEADAVIAISDAIYKKYKKILKNKNFVRIYNGIMVEQFYEPNKKIMLEDCIQLLCVGRVCEGKGQKDLINALGILKEKRDFKLRASFAGTYDNKSINECRKLAEKTKVSDQIEFLGQVKNMRELYEKSDIFCMCSHCEAFGRVTVEAMLIGDFIIGANSGGTPEVLHNGEYGLLYTPGDCEELADKIIMAIEDKTKTSNIADLGREYAKNNFDAEINAENIYNLYRSILVK